ncbi:MAG: carbohydrate porin [Candidatus Omnitrophota bacterium]
MSTRFFKKPVLFTVIFSVFFAGWSFADELSIFDEINLLKKRISALEDKAARQEKYIATQNVIAEEQKQKITEYESKFSQFEEKFHRVPVDTMQLMEGLELGVGATMIVQGANNVNYGGEGHTQKKSRTDGSYSADLTLAKEFKEVRGRAFLHLEAGQGAGLEDNLTLYSNVNRDAGDSEARIEVTEFWYEQSLFNNKAAITFGKLDPSAYFDQNEVANDETLQFLGRIFRNAPTIEFPDNGAGIRFAYLPAEWMELGYGLFNSNSGWEKIGGNLFNIGQVTFKTNFLNLAGNYRFYGWANNANHTNWLDMEKTKETAYGFGLSFDQKANDIVTLFARYGWQNPKVYNPEIKTTTGDGLNYSLEQSWSAGFQIEGRPWGREKDIFAFAVGQVMPSNDYKKQDASLSAKTEGHLETYYRIYINDHLSISPDFQYIWNPYGKDVAGDTSSIFVGGMRAQVDF